MVAENQHSFLSKLERKHFRGPGEKILGPQPHQNLSNFSPQPNNPKNPFLSSIFYPPYFHPNQMDPKGLLVRFIPCCISLFHKCRVHHITKFRLVCHFKFHLQVSTEYFVPKNTTPIALEIASNYGEALETYFKIILHPFWMAKISVKKNILSSLWTNTIHMVKQQRKSHKRRP